MKESLLEYQMVTKTYLKPTYLCDSSNNSNRGDSSNSSDSSNNRDSRDSSDSDSSESSDSSDYCIPLAEARPPSQDDLVTEVTLHRLLGQRGAYRQHRNRTGDM